MKFAAIAILGLLVMSSLAIGAPNSSAATSNKCAVLIDFGNGQVYWSDITVTPGMNALNVTRLAVAEQGFVMTEAFGYLSTINGLGYNFTTGEYWNFWTWNTTRSVWDWSMVGAGLTNASRVSAIAWSYAPSYDPMNFTQPYDPVATPDHRYPWTVFRHDSSNTGSQPIYAPNNLTLKWAANLGNGNVDAPIIVANGSEYVITGGVYNFTANAYDTNSSVKRISSSGSVIWSADIGKGYQVGSPLLLATMTAVKNANTVIVPSASGVVYAFNANNGRMLWKFDTHSPTYGVVSSPCAYLNQIFIAGGNGKLFCLDMDGGQVWNMTVGSAFYSSSPSFLNGFLYIGADDGRLHAISTSNGVQAWSVPIGTEVRGSPILLDNEIIVTYKNSTASNGGVAAVSYGGVLLWKTVTGVSPASAALTSVGIASITSTSMVMVALNGSVLWTTSVGTSFAGGAPTTVNGTIYMVTNEATSRLLAISEAGQIYSTQPLLPAQYALSAPTISDGVLYVGADNGYVYAYNLNDVPFSFPGSMVKDGLTVHFDATASKGTLFEYLWNFGDGNTSTLSKVDHIYAKAGTYNVTLTVTSPSGQASDVTPITVVAPSTSNNDWVWIVLAIVIVVVVLLVAALLVVRAKKGKSK